MSPRSKPLTWPAAALRLYKTAAIPAIMALGFLGLFIYYQTQGGYKPVELASTEPAATHADQPGGTIEETDEAATGMGQPAPSEY